MRDPDAGRLLFSDLNAILNLSTLSDIVQYAQRTMAECTQFFGRGACRISGILQIFRPIFAQILRDLGAGLALYLALERAPIRKIDASKFSGFCSNTGRVPAILCVRRAEHFPEICNSFARGLGAKFTSDFRQKFE